VTPVEMGMIRCSPRLARSLSLRRFAAAVG
jgi:hypothetical protein